jgi:hypothetical protein
MVEGLMKSRRRRSVQVTRWQRTPQYAISAAHQCKRYYDVYCCIMLRTISCISSSPASASLLNSSLLRFRHSSSSPTSGLWIPISSAVVKAPKTHTVRNLFVDVIGSFALSQIILSQIFTRSRQCSPYSALDRFSLVRVLKIARL